MLRLNRLKSLSLACTLALSAVTVITAQTLEDLLAERKPVAPDLTSASKDQWKRMLEAFASNDDAKGMELCQSLLGANQVLTPLQIQASKLLLRIGDDQSATDKPGMAQLKADGTRLLNEAREADAKLIGIQASFKQIPTPFSQGSQSHYKWVQLENLQKIWTEKRDALNTQLQEMRKQYDQFKAEESRDLEKQLLELAENLANDNEIDGALALCNLYLRKRANTHEVAVQGQKLVELKNKQARAMKMAEALTGQARDLTKQGKWATAQMEIAKGKAMVASRVEDPREQEFFNTFLKPLEEEINKTVSDAETEAVEIQRFAADKPADALKRLVSLQQKVVDLPQIASAQAAIDAAKTAKEDAVYDGRLKAVTELAQTDPTAARTLLDEYRQNMSPEDFVTLKAKLQGTWRQIWEKELEAIRADQDEAHSFLTKISSSFQMALEKGDEPAIRAAMVMTPDAKENLTRSKGLLAGGIRQLDAIPTSDLDAVLKSRVEGLKGSITASLAQLQHAEELSQPSPLLQNKPEQPNWFAPSVIGFASLAGVVGICIIAMRKKRGHSKAV